MLSEWAMLIHSLTFVTTRLDATLCVSTKTPSPELGTSIPVGGNAEIDASGDPALNAETVETDSRRVVVDIGPASAVATQAMTAKATAVRMVADLIGAQCSFPADEDGRREISEAWVGWPDTQTTCV